MLTRLHQRLLIRLMPIKLLDAMHIVYEECIDSCRTRTPKPLIHPIESFAGWLRQAHQAGWTPPPRPIHIDGTPYVIDLDDGSEPTWLRDEVCYLDDLQ